MEEFRFDGGIEERLILINNKCIDTLKSIYGLLKTIKSIEAILDSANPEQHDLDSANVVLHKWVHGSGKSLEGATFATLWRLDSHVVHAVKMANVARLRPHLITVPNPFDEFCTPKIEVTAHGHVCVLCDVFWVYHWSVNPVFEKDLLPFEIDDFRKLINDAKHDFGETTDTELLMLQGWVEIEFLQTLTHLQQHSVIQKAGQQHDNDKKPEKSLPENSDVADLCLYLKTKLPDFSTQMACARSFCTNSNIDQKKAENLLRQAKRFTHLWKS